MSAPIEVFGNTGVKAFTTPAGWEDALLVLEAVPVDKATHGPPR